MAEINRSLMPTRRKMNATLLALFFFPLISASAADAPPPMATIVQQVIAQAQATLEALQSLEFHATLNVDQLDGLGQVTQQQKLQLLVRPGAPQEIKVLSDTGAGGNHPAHPKEAPPRPTQDIETRKSQINVGLNDLVNRFDLAVAGTGALQGQPVYIVSFEPKPDQPAPNVMIKILNYLHGRVWVSARDYSVLKMEATLTRPVPVAWIFAHVNSVDFHYELNHAPGVMGPAHIEGSFRFDAPLITISRRMTIETTPFQPRAKT
jgi:hypothetical protein